MHLKQSSDSSRTRILHVLTLNGNSGIYGGPSQVAQNLCNALHEAGYDVSILSGCLESQDSNIDCQHKYSSVLVKPILKSQPLTSLMSLKMITELIHKVKNNDVVHIHFARELIPVSAAIACLLFKRKYILQTHGMVKPDNRNLIRLLDKFVIRFLLRKSSAILTLNNVESQKIAHFSKNNIELLPNGINLDDYQNLGFTKRNRVIFCSRINERKRPELFVDAALLVMNQYPTFSFEIYGPDGGGLQLLEKHLQKKGFQLKDFYFGPLNHGEVRQKLAESLVLVLPSYEEPFPMIVLESLAAGTPVVVMPSCHISETLRKINSNFVSKEESAKGIAKALSAQLKKLANEPNYYKTPEACRIYFGIDSVFQKLQEIYEKTIIAK